MKLLFVTSKQIIHSPTFVRNQVDYFNPTGILYGGIAAVSYKNHFRCNLVIIKGYYTNLEEKEVEFVALIWTSRDIVS